MTICRLTRAAVAVIFIIVNEEKKGNYWKFAVAFVVIVVLALGVFVAARVYEKFQADKKIQEAIETLQKNAAEAYARALADTYGGKTPQETLQMYIDAVESGDYVLASKYFIGDNQEKELEKLSNINQKNNSNEYLDYLRVAKPWQSSLGETSFTMESKIGLAPSLFIRFTKYPNGIWKIIEI